MSSEMPRGLLKRKAMLEIIAYIGNHGPQRHTDLRQTLTVSSSTLQKRLSEGYSANLLTPKIRDGDTAKVWALTDLGETIYERAQKKNLPSLFKQRRQREKEVEEAKKTVVNPNPVPESIAITDKSTV